jgi:hypothetical protein
MTDSAPVPSGWYPDYTKRFEQRYWDGTQWTEHVFSNGQQLVDPLGIAVPNSQASEVVSRAVDNNPAAVAIGAGWPDIEVAGESYHRLEMSRVFLGLGRPEGGVTMQVAYLEPEPKNRFDRNAVKVIVRGEHIGYVPEEFSAEVAAACKRVGRGRVATAPARVWARVDGDLWRARVTLSFSGAKEEERDYAADRRAVQERDAQRAAEAQQRVAEREARESAKLARRQAGEVRGQYWPTWKPAIAELKRQQRLDEARAFLVECRDAASRESQVTGEVPDPWAAEQLAAVVRRQGDRAGELATLEAYAAECGDRSIPDSVVAKLAKARIANGASA